MSQVTVITGAERRRRWTDEEQREILAAAFAPSANVRDVARRYDVATSMIYKWRREALALGRVPGFAEMVMVPQAPAVPAPVATVEIEIDGKAVIRLPTSTPPGLASAIVKALGLR